MPRCALALKASAWKLTHTISVHTLLVKASHMAMPKANGTEKCNPTMCMESGRKKKQTFANSPNENHTDIM